MKKSIKFVLISFMILLISFIGSSIYMQTTLASKVLRLHILANSNSSYDQELKLLVRNDIVAFLTPLLEKSSSLTETKAIIANNMSKIHEIAQNAVTEYSTDSVSCFLGSSSFPTKYYGNYSFPAGKYEALKIVIGEGKGNNWWCVMFPPLCFTSSSAGTFDDSSDEKLQEVLSEDEYKSITSINDKKVRVKFRFLEWWNSR